MHLSSLVSTRAQAVVFFDDSDELSVLDHKGHIEPLQTLSFVKQLDVCLIILDEAYTRGTDLRLLEYSRAAVTLRANVTNDRFVQGTSANPLVIVTDFRVACMRMRKLDKG